MWRLRDCALLRWLVRTASKGFAYRLIDGTAGVFGRLGALIAALGRGQPITIRELPPVLVGCRVYWSFIAPISVLSTIAPSIEQPLTRETLIAVY